MPIILKWKFLLVSTLLDCNYSKDHSILSSYQWKIYSLNL